jgi:hypothetical protein
LSFPSLVDQEIRKVFLFSLFLITNFCFANLGSITQSEYFIGTDPGEGNGTSLSPADGNFSHSLEAILDTNLSVASLSLGTHILNIRYKDDNGTWGEILKQPFTVFNPAPDLNQSGTTGNYSIHGISNIATSEYFIGTDPGEGNGTSLSSADGNFSHSVESILDTNLSVASLSLGPHILNIRYKDENGTWGEILKQPFTVFNPAPDLNQSGTTGNYSLLGISNIATSEYFIGTDPGEGNGTSLSPADGNFSHSLEAILDTNLSVASLSIGTHILNIRYKDDNGTWGEILKQPFTVFNPSPDLNQTGSTGNSNLYGISNIATSEYFIGTDPGEGNGTYLLPADGNFSHSLEAILDTNLSVASLSIGTHILNIRYKDDNGTWGEILKQPFTIFNPAPDLNQSGTTGNYSIHGISNIAAAEYFIDADPGEGNATSLTPADGNFSHSLESIVDTQISVSTLSLGIHQIGIRYQDSNGTWGEVLKSNFKVEAFTGHYSPTNLALDNNSIFENRPVGSTIGTFTAIDPDANNTLTYSFIDNNNTSPQNNLFALESNGTLKTSSSFDYESNNTYSIRVQVKDDHNATTEGNFSILINNIIEDFDGDGTEDAYDSDDDNDGFSDHSEIAYGSNPRDANSTANASPTDLNTSSPLQIAENQTIGSIVGQLTATDPDANSTLTFGLVNQGGQSPADAMDNHLFSMDSNGTLKTAAVFDFESNSSFTINAKVRDQHNVTIKQTFTVQITNIMEDFDSDGIEDANDPDDDNDGFSDTAELAYGSNPLDANSTANAAPTQLIADSNLTILEKSPSGTIIGTFSAQDIDSKTTLTYSLIEGNSSTHNQAFSLDPNGTLSSAILFDYESNLTAYSITVQVADQFNASIQQTFPVYVLNDPSDDPQPPIDSNQTTEPIIDQNQTDSNSTTAPIADQNATPTSENNQTIVVQPGPVTPSQPDANQTQTYWWTPLPETAEGWRTSDWFGSFRPFTNSWLYHTELGWMHATQGETDDLWLWNQEFGWLWTANGVFPHLFNHASANWIYFLKKQDGKAHYYDYTTESVK